MEIKTTVTGGIPVKETRQAIVDLLRIGRSHYDFEAARDRVLLKAKDEDFCE